MKMEHSSVSSANSPSRTSEGRKEGASVHKLPTLPPNRLLPSNQKYSKPFSRGNNAPRTPLSRPLIVHSLSTPLNAPPSHFIILI